VGSIAKGTCEVEIGMMSFNRWQCLSGLGGGSGMVSVKPSSPGPGCCQVGSDGGGLWAGTGWGVMEQRGLNGRWPSS
jgi:hypothetical protein